MKANEDVFHGCDGFNHVLKDIIVKRDDNGTIFDIDIFGLDGHSGSLFHCVTQETPTPAQINEYHMVWIELQPEEFKSYWPEKYQKYVNALKNNTSVCDDRGLKTI